MLKRECLEACKEMMDLILLHKEDLNTAVWEKKYPVLLGHLFHDDIVYCWPCKNMFEALYQEITAPGLDNSIP